MCSTQETYATVDEVNEVLTNYVQTKDFPEIDLSWYVLKSDFDALKIENDNLKAEIAECRKKDDISIKRTTLKTLACTSSTTTRFHYETDEFIDHAQIKGSLTIGNQTITFDFEFIDDGRNICYFNNKNGMMQWRYISSNSKYWMVISYGGNQPEFNIKSITYYDYDEFALKSQYDKLEKDTIILVDTIKRLEKRIKALENV